MVAVYGVEHTDKGISSGLFTSLLNSLPIKNQNQIINKVQQHDREMALISQILLRHIFINDYKIKIDKIRILNGLHGKPFIETNRDLFFNLSHSGNWVFLAVSNKEVGVDIEKEKEIEINTAINFFSREEYNYLQNQKGEKANSEFFKIWTLKESYVKALGLGLYKPLRSFTVITNHEEVKLRDSETPENNTAWNWEYLQIKKGYHLSVCMNSENSSCSVQTIESSQLINAYLTHVFSFKTAWSIIKGINDCKNSHQVN